MRPGQPGVIAVAGDDSEAIRTAGVQQFHGVHDESGVGGADAMEPASPGRPEAGYSMVRSHAHHRAGLMGFAPAYAALPGLSAMAIGPLWILDRPTDDKFPESPLRSP